MWEEVLVWGLCETASGFRGLLLESEKEGNHIFQLIEKISLLTDREFKEFLHNGWGDLDSGTQNTPCPAYENHFSSAAAIYEALPQKNIQQEATFAEGLGREMHIEIGTTNKLCYLYWANVFDQRQLLLIDDDGAEILHDYYQESLESARDSS